MSIDFVFARMPEIHFGPGKLAQLPKMIQAAGKRILLVTGSASFRNSVHGENLLHDLAQAGARVFSVAVTGEPTPQFVDDVANRYRDNGLDWVVGIGGGSAIDAGKAISAMLPQSDSVSAFLEGRATTEHDGRKIPFVAVPTSSGTGAEATKNAVLSQIGQDGYKCSLRHDRLVPDIAVIDPQLMLSCPPDVTAACGLDALTQLLESYVSAKASPMTDALAQSGIEHVAAGFLPAFEHGGTDIAARSHMAYAALISGVTLANAGLGAVHGFAGPIGGFFPIPHGVVCGTLLGEATQATIDALFAEREKFEPALRKYARAGVLLSDQSSGSLEGDCALLVATLRRWIETTGIPRLGDFGMTRADFPKILDAANCKNSPVTLSREEMSSILESRL
jgi:alcohol dehydrogenase class IV